MAGALGVFASANAGITFPNGLVVDGAFPTLNAVVYAIAPDSSGGLWVGGNFTLTSGGKTYNRLVRLGADGAVDTTIDSIDIAAAVRALAIQPDGNIVVGGQFVTVNGVTRNRLIRITPTGAVDTTFTPNVSSTVSTIAVQSTGRIIIGGLFTQVNSVSKPYICGLNSSGVIDSTFVTTVAAAVNSVKRMSGDRLYFGGNFTQVNGTTRNAVARLNANGTLDATFAPPSGVNTVYDWHELDNGDVLMTCGSFPNTPSNILGVVRVTSTGTLVSGNSLGFSATPTIYKIIPTGDGRFWLAGSFISTVGGVERRGLVRMNADGTRDSTWQASVATGVVQDLYLDPTRRLVAGGSIATVNGVAQPNLARFLP